MATPVRYESSQHCGFITLGVEGTGIWILWTGGETWAGGGHDRENVLPWSIHPTLRLQLGAILVQLHLLRLDVAVVFTYVYVSIWNINKVINWRSTLGLFWFPVAWLPAARGCCLDKCLTQHGERIQELLQQPEGISQGLLTEHLDLFDQNLIQEQATIYSMLSWYRSSDNLYFTHTYPGKPWMVESLQDCISLLRFPKQAFISLHAWVQTLVIKKKKDSF